MHRSQISANSADESTLWTRLRLFLSQVPVTLCFIDLSGFTRYTEEGDLEALDVVENFVETVEATLPPEAVVLVKTIGVR